MADLYPGITSEFISELARVLEKPQVLREDLRATAWRDFLFGLEPVAVVEPLVLEHFYTEEREAHTEAIARRDSIGGGDLRNEVEGHDPRISITHRLPGFALGPIQATYGVIIVDGFV